MRLANSQLAIDWSNMAKVVQPGETGTSAVRTCNLGDITLRIVTYGPGFRADHWCAKGHMVYVISGCLVIEYEDQTRTALSAGMSWRAPDDANPPRYVRLAQLSSSSIEYVRTLSDVIHNAAPLNLIRLKPQRPCSSQRSPRWAASSRKARYMA